MNLLPVFFILRCVHSRPGSTMDDGVRLQLADQILYSILICYIQLTIRASCSGVYVSRV